MNQGSLGKWKEVKQSTEPTPAKGAGVPACLTMCEEEGQEKP